MSKAKEATWCMKHAGGVLGFLELRAFGGWSSTRSSRAQGWTWAEGQRTVMLGHPLVKQPLGCLRKKSITESTVTV